MEYTMTAGAKFHSLSKQELDASLKEWMVDVVKGMRPIVISAQGTADSAGAIALGGATTLAGGTLGPAQGMCWAVTRLAVRVDSVPAAYSLYNSALSPTRLIRDVDASAGGYVNFGPQELMLTTGESLLVQARSTANGGPIIVSGAAIEMPNQLLWKWLAGG